MLATAVQEAPWRVDSMKSKTEAFAYRRRGQEGSVVLDVIVRQRYETPVQNVFVTDRLGPSSGWTIHHPDRGELSAWS
jgi:hypothetical protein